MGYSVSLGFKSSSIAETTGIAAAVYGIAQFSATASSSRLSSNFLYPYFSRLNPNSDLYSKSYVSCIKYYSNFEGGWDKVGIFAEASEYSISLAESFIYNAENQDIIISAFFEYLAKQENFNFELELIKNSKARIIMFFIGIFSTDYDTILQNANEVGLIGENYVWFLTPGYTDAEFLNPNPLSNGMIGPSLYLPESPAKDLFYEIWDSADPQKYPGTQNRPHFIDILYYDLAITFAHALDYLYKENDQSISKLNSITAPVWSNTFRNTTLLGATGTILIDEYGDRSSQLKMVYYDATNNKWRFSAIFTPKEISSTNETTYELVSDIVWYSNTTKIPDLDIRDPFDYWSCHDKTKKTDETGKTITLHTPNESDIDEIAYHYYCDNFIDCKNFSDESSDGCSSNFLILFIVFGILGGIIICIAVLLVFFVIIFGYVLEYRRVLKASPLFLIVILLSVIVGTSSIYAWFGKPHPVSCAFQPWLLGFPCLSMITALTVKNLRLWRIFRFPMEKTRISNIELCIYWCLIMIPALIILIIWSIISTPTAKMKNTGEDDGDHFVCATGGFTEEPGGYVFFGIFVGYSFLVLLLGAFISVLSRKVPSQFSETKILTISIYNLVFLVLLLFLFFLL